VYFFSKLSEHFFVNIKGGDPYIFCPALVSEKGGESAFSSFYVNVITDLLLFITL
jgi:hypothetical protein